MLQYLVSTSCSLTLIVRLFVIDAKASFLSQLRYSCCLLIHWHWSLKSWLDDSLRMIGLLYAEKIWQYIKPFSSYSDTTVVLDSYLWCFPVAYLGGGTRVSVPPPHCLEKFFALHVITYEVVHIDQYYKILHNFTNNFRGNLSASGGFALDPPLGRCPLTPWGQAPRPPRVPPFPNSCIRHWNHEL